jgi:hypothetical protein
MRPGCLLSRSQRVCARHLEAKLTPIRERWAALWEDSRKTVGSIHDFTRDDLPELGEYNTPPVPSAESLARNGVTIPAPVKAPPVSEPEPEHALTA